MGSNGNESKIQYVEADKKFRDRISKEWSQIAANHMHIEDGFSIVAMDKDELVALISVYWKSMPKPMDGIYDGYIDIIEVRNDYRGMGIARRLIEMACKRCKKQGAFQIRAWSSQDKQEAVKMWKTLGFGLCPTYIFSEKTGTNIDGFYVAKAL